MANTELETAIYDTIHRLHPDATVDDYRTKIGLDNAVLADDAKQVYVGDSFDPIPKESIPYFSVLIEEPLVGASEELYNGGYVEDGDYISFVTVAYSSPDKDDVQTKMKRLAHGAVRARGEEPTIKGLSVGRVLGEGFVVASIESIEVAPLEDESRLAGAFICTVAVDPELVSDVISM